MNHLLKVVLVCAAVIVAAASTVRYVAHRSFKYASKGLEMQKIDGAAGLPLVKQVPFYFIRHGETDANKGHIFVGSLDVPLNENGIRQAHAAAEKMVDLPIVTIVTSPLQRARVTAEIIGARLGKPVIEIKGLREWSAGELEGRPLTKSLRDRVNDGPIAGAEEFAAYHARIAAALNEALALPGPVLVVAHGGVHQVIQEALGIPVSKIANATPLLHQPPQTVGGAWTMREH